MSNATTGLLNGRDGLVNQSINLGRRLGVRDHNRLLDINGSSALEERKAGSEKSKRAHSGGWKMAVKNGKVKEMERARH